VRGVSRGVVRDAHCCPIRGSQDAHASLVRAIVDLLGLMRPRIECSAVNQRPVETRKGWRCPGACAGFPDVVGVLPPDGRCLLIEAKTGESQLRVEQRALRGRWVAAGALWITARSVSDVVEALDWKQRCG